MSVVVQTPFNQHTANGVTTLFGFTFQLLAATDLAVFLDGVPQSTGFTISGLGVQAGGSITFDVAPANGVIVDIQRDIPLARSTDYQTNGDLPANELDRDYDRLWQALQDQNFKAGLAVQVPLGDTAAPVTIPSVSERAGRFLAFDGSGNPIAADAVDGTVPVSAFMQTLLDDADAAAGRATLGAQAAGSYANSGAVGSSGLTMATDRVLGRVSASTGAPEELTRSQLAVLATSKIQPITATVGSNALTLTLNPTTLDFRSGGALASGDVFTRSVPSAITLTVSSGSTLGSSNGVLSRLAVLAMDNAGTVELAVVNLLGGVILNELGLISTSAEGGAGGADSASTVYSASARAFLPYRIVGFVEITQATAGTWATAPSLVNGSGAPLATWLAGYGQTSQGLTGSRALNTTYTNNTGRPIEVYVSAIGSSSADTYVQLLIDGNQRARSSVSYQEAGVWRFIYNTLSFKVPPGSTYRVDVVGGTATLTLWSEER